MSDSWPALAVVLLISLALVGAIVWLVLGGTTYAARRPESRRRPPRHAFGRDKEAEAPSKRAAIIVNPTKFTDVAAIKRELTATSVRLGWREPLILETTADDPGTGQAEQALEAGVDLVCPLGGDGTIRSVAAALGHTRTPMGLLPRGTGNLLARNLGVPMGDVSAALEVACTGRNKAIDVGWIVLDPPPATAEGRSTTEGLPDDHTTAKDESSSGDEASTEPESSTESESSSEPEFSTEPPVAPGTGTPFLVMAGMGFDAAIMGQTSEPLKERLGWGAYFLTGLQRIFIRRFAVDWSVDGDAQPRLHARTIVFGNCGTLTGGIVLMPEARLDDGSLDAVVVTPKTLVGWGGIAIRVLGRSSREMTQLARATGQRFTATVDTPQAVQVDGDVIGQASTLEVSVEPKSLIVRVSG